MILHLAAMVCTAAALSGFDNRYHKWSHDATLRNPRFSQWFHSPKYNYEHNAIQYPYSSTRETFQDQIRKDLNRLSGLYFSPQLLGQNAVVSYSPQQLKTDLTEFFAIYTTAPLAFTRLPDLYLQGMHSIAGTLLLSLNGDKPRAYRVFLMILNDYGLYDSIHGERQVHLTRLTTLGYLLKQKKLMPESLEDLHVGFTDRWVSSLFQHEYKLSPLVRVGIFDGFIQHGWKIIYATSLAVFDLLQPHFQSEDADYRIAQDFTQYIPDHALILTKTREYLNQLSDRLLLQLERRFKLVESQPIFTTARGPLWESKLPQLSTSFDHLHQQARDHFNHLPLERLNKQAIEAMKSFYFSPSLLLYRKVDESVATPVAFHISMFQLLVTYADHYETTEISSSIASSVLLSLNGDLDQAFRSLSYLSIQIQKISIQSSMILLETAAWRLIRDVTAQLDALGQPISKITPSQWFLTMFQTELELKPRVRIEILDGFFKYGWRWIYAVALAVFKTLDLTNEDFMQHPFTKQDELLPIAREYLTRMVEKDTIY